MPSRKKAKGKARKAAKEAEAVRAEENESQAVAEMAANQRQEESLEAQMQRLIINATSSKHCRHGCPSLSTDESNIFKDFINAYLATSSKQNKVVEGLVAAYEVTEVEYADVYDSKLEAVISIFLSRGTQRILDGDNRQAQLYAMLACYFENYMALCLLKTQAINNSTNPVELESADDHTLVSYYRKRIPCSCLDRKYKEVKSVKKTGLCYNQNCSLPDGRVERSKMLCCTRCGLANYCSVECQRANWNQHREVCAKTAEEKATFIALAEQS